jgi:hypothetical protein
MLQDRGISLVGAMSTSMVISGAVALVAIWAGPETRGRTFESTP